MFRTRHGKTIGLLMGTTAALASAGCGKALPFPHGEYLGPSVLSADGSRAAGSDVGSIYPVTKIVEPAGSGGIPGWLQADLPLTGAPVSIGQAVTDGQTPVYFDFDYPPNNYKLAEAHLVIDTSRDTSDTEGIFVDGVLSGRPPLAMVNGTSPMVDFAVHFGGPDPTPNTYYIDWSLDHYKRLTRNTFDLDLLSLLDRSTLTEVDVLSDGFLPIVTGDDSPIYQGYLVMKGYTVSRDPLDCVTSPSYTFENVYLHEDLSSIGTPAFDAAEKSPFDSWTTALQAGQSVEFHYDALLPKVDVEGVALTSATIQLTVKRDGALPSAFVINGVGIDEPGFDRGAATSSVESWVSDAGARAAWATFVATIPGDRSATAVTLNLAGIFGASTIKALVAQGKTNVAFAGGIAEASATAAAATRGFGSPVNGPEFTLQGTYATELCEIPNDPDSPLVDGEPIPPGIGDETGPEIASVQASEITSTSAVIQWLTDEGSTSQVQYGIGGTGSSSPEDDDLVTFHRIELTGLLPYKYYTFKVRSADGNGNLSVSATAMFRTLR